MRFIRKNFSKAFLLPLVSLLIGGELLSSCAMMFGKKQTITVTSNPSGADVYIDNELYGRTPFYFTTKTASSYMTFVKQGYVTQTIHTPTRLRRSVWLNLLITGPLGFGIDAISGWKYRRTEFSANLTPAPVTVSPTPSTPQTQLEIPKEVPPTQETLTRIMASMSSAKLRKQDIYKKYKNAVFMVFTSDNRQMFQGSGFFVSPDGIAISNYHVFEGTFKGEEVIKLLDGRTFNVEKVLGYSEKNDYIIFKISGNNFDYIPITLKGCEVGDEAYALGSPRGMENTFNVGTISSIREGGNIQIDINIDHGSSGGALINEYGQIIGITFGGQDDSKANINFAKDIRLIFPDVRL